MSAIYAQARACDMDWQKAKYHFKSWMLKRQHSDWLTIIYAHTRAHTQMAWEEAKSISIISNLGC